MTKEQFNELPIFSPISPLSEVFSYPGGEGVVKANLKPLQLDFLKAAKRQNRDPAEAEKAAMGLRIYFDPFKFHKAIIIESLKGIENPFSRKLLRFMLRISSALDVVTSGLTLGSAYSIKSKEGCVEAMGVFFTPKLS